MYHIRIIPIVCAFDFLSYEGIYMPGLKKVAFGLCDTEN